MVFSGVVNYEWRMYSQVTTSTDETKLFSPLLRELEHKIVNMKNGTDLRKV